MNPTSTVGSLAYTPSNKITNFSIQKIDNGFLISYYDGAVGNRTFHCATLGLVKDQLENIFETN